MVTLRRSTRRSTRGGKSSARTANPRGSDESAPIPASSTTESIPTSIPTVSPQNSPVPVIISANRSPSIVPMPSFTYRPSQESFDFDGIQYSPYFLTSGDNPGTSIISEVLDGTNYNTWIIAITIALDAKNKIAFVDGSLPRPPESHPHYRIRSRCNSMVKSWILNSITKEIYGSILRFNDAHEIWKDLMTRFRITNLPRSYQLTQQIWSLQQGSMDLSTYYTKLKTLWDDLDGADCAKTCHACDCCKATATKAEHTKIIKFLAGLNDSYSQARSQIIMKKNVSDLAEVYNLLDQDHSQRSINPVPNATAFQMTMPNQIPASVNAAYNPRQTRPMCSHCGFSGHTVDKCYKVHGYPPGFKHKQKFQPERAQPDKRTTSRPMVAQVSAVDTTQHDNGSEIVQNLTKDQIAGVIAYFNSQLQTSSDSHNGQSSMSGGTITALPGMAFSSSTLCFVGILQATKNALSIKSWIIDSGATHHVARDKNLFVSFSDSLQSSVTLPTGLGVAIAGIGTVKLNDHLVLNNVLYIPDFRLNLLSVSQLTKDLGYRVIFDPDSCMIQDHTKGLMIGQGEQVSNLYVLDAECIDESVLSLIQSTFSSNVVLDSTLWHNRLGHPSITKLDCIQDVLGFKQRNKDHFHCAICPLAKREASFIYI
uniref:Retrovirus-related Pol polyprotein from transposon TNT 1-94 n=1 Tax=Noccaea caerulescens TaxID=107243 RepID=A0A1J3EFZ9_NOCCA